MASIEVIAFYLFVNLEDYCDLRDRLLKKCIHFDIKGTILLAKEGINGTISGTPSNIKSILHVIKQEPRFAALEHKSSFVNEHPFYRMKVKLKREIVTIGIDTNPSEQVGKYLDPKEWNQLISDSNTLIIDTRNKYETDIGKFKNAILPNTNSFRDFPDFAKQNLPYAKDKPIAMYCTGGIRCEKSTSLLIKMGYTNVYHLRGGILKYLETVPEQDSLWQGECFVFDNRVALNNKLAPGSYDQCFGCRSPITDEDKNSGQYLAGIHCPKCYNKISKDKFKRAAQRQLQINLAKERNQLHLGENCRTK